MNCDLNIPLKKELVADWAAGKVKRSKVDMQCGLAVEDCCRNDLIWMILAIVTAD